MKQINVNFLIRLTITLGYSPVVAYYGTIPEVAGPNAFFIDKK